MAASWEFTTGRKGPGNPTGDAAVSCCVNTRNAFRRYGIMGFVLLGIGVFFRFLGFRSAVGGGLGLGDTEGNFFQRAADAQVYAEIGLVFLILGPSLIFLSALFDLIRKTRE